MKISKKSALEASVSERLASVSERLASEAAISTANRIIEDNRKAIFPDFISYEQRLKAQRFDEPNAITSADDAITNADDATPSTNEDLLQLVREYKPVKQDISRRQFLLIHLAITCACLLLIWIN